MILCVNLKKTCIQIITILIGFFPRHFGYMGRFIDKNATFDFQIFKLHKEFIVFSFYPYQRKSTHPFGQESLLLPVFSETEVALAFVNKKNNSKIILSLFQEMKQKSYSFDMLSFNSLSLICVKLFNFWQKLETEFKNMKT